jgi:DNA-binding MarR family transcriptional regulator
LFLLRQVAAHEELSINALAERTMTQQSTVSLLVRRLEEAGFVERTRSSRDARQVLVTLTRQGRLVARRAPKSPLGRMVESLDRLPAGEVEALIHGLGSLLRDMRVPAAAGPLFEASPASRANAARKRAAK